MALDTAPKRFNFLRFGIRLLPIGLVGPIAGLDTDDRENGAGLVISLTYDPTAVGGNVVPGKIPVGIGIGF